MSSVRGPKRKSSAANLPRLSKERLEELVDEATIDAYNESEQVVGFLTMMEDNLKLPFDTDVLGVSVIVKKVDMTDDDQIVAVCTRAGKKQEIPIHSMPLPSPPPEGWEWNCRLSLLQARLRMRRFRSLGASHENSAAREGHYCDCRVLD